MSIALPSAANRHQSLDILRGIALLGILLMNMPYFADYYVSAGNLLVNGEFSGPDYYSWWVVNGFFEGTMRAIFSVLFGAGSLLFLESLKGLKERGLTPADLLYRRLIWLLVFGFINAYVFLWPGDILYTYAITGLFLYPFRVLPARKLFAFAALFLVFSTLQFSTGMWKKGGIREEGIQAEERKSAGKPLNAIQQQQLTEWQEYQKQNNLATIRQEAAENRQKLSAGSYSECFAEMVGVNKYIQTKDFYTELFFDALAFFLLGMALYRSGYLQGSHPAARYGLAALLSYAAGLPLSWLFNHTSIMTGFDASRLAETFPVHPYQIRRLLLSMGHISLVLWLWKSFGAGLPGRLLASVGRMAFTGYLMQSLICTWIFMGYGLGYYGKLHRWQLYPVAFVIWAFLLIFSSVWLRFFQMGPFEWLWRCLTWWEWRPIRKQAVP